jgi:hypothetical protein
LGKFSSFFLFGLVGGWWFRKVRQGQLCFIFQVINDWSTILPNEKRMHFFIKNEPASVFQNHIMIVWQGKTRRSIRK